MFQIAVILPSKGKQIQRKNEREKRRKKRRKLKET
jgi:hypothetical protein